MIGIVDSGEEVFSGVFELTVFSDFISHVVIKSLSVISEFIGSFSEFSLDVFDHRNSFFFVFIDFV